MEVGVFPGYADAEPSRVSHTLHKRAFVPTLNTLIKRSQNFQRKVSRLQEEGGGLVEAFYNLSSFEE